jgi:hypothetical protein
MAQFWADFAAWNDWVTVRAKHLAHMPCVVRRGQSQARRMTL